MNELPQWRRRARELLLKQIPPEHADWSAVHTPQCGDACGARVTNTLPRISKRFLDMAEKVLCHTDEERHALLYAAAWRLSHGEPYLLELAHDPLVRKLGVCEKAVRREIHKAHAFVRFTRIAADHKGDSSSRNSQGGANANVEARYVAWFEPTHSIMRLIAPFFRNRFTNMHWTILSPLECVAWDGKNLRFTPGIEKPKVATQDLIGAAWKTYYANIFNPARLKIAAMKREMAVRYWKNMPETELIANLIATAPARAHEMVERARLVAAEHPVVTEPKSEAEAETPLAVADSPQDCRRCPHAVHATQAVLGEGSQTARIVVIGEQPGDREDLEGRPFVGPAGGVLNKALEAAGLDRSALYLTNAVKHFSWELRGKRRLHKTPGQRAVLACRDFLMRELASINPAVIVCLGRTAVTAATEGTGVTVERGVPLKLPGGKWLLATYHPAFLLRQTDAGPELFEEFAAHLRTARELAERSVPIS